MKNVLIIALGCSLAAVVAGKDWAAWMAPTTEEVPCPHITQQEFTRAITGKSYAQMDEYIATMCDPHNDKVRAAQARVIARLSHPIQIQPPY